MISTNAIHGPRVQVSLLEQLDAVDKAVANEIRSASCEAVEEGARVRLLGWKANPAKTLAEDQEVGDAENRAAALLRIKAH
jgi:hypothetical protein